MKQFRRPNLVANFILSFLVLATGLALGVSSAFAAAVAPSAKTIMASSKGSSPSVKSTSTKLTVPDFLAGFTSKYVQDGDSPWAPDSLSGLYMHEGTFAISAVDWDGDGDTDIINGTTLYTNDGTDHFTRTNDFFDTGYPDTLPDTADSSEYELDSAVTTFVTDWDGDGDYDILGRFEVDRIAAWSSQYTDKDIVELYLNDGSGNLSDACRLLIQPSSGGGWEYYEYGYSGGFGAVDADGDGDQDVFLYGQNNDDLFDSYMLHYFKNTNDGSVPCGPYEEVDLDTSFATGAGSVEQILFTDWNNGGVADLNIAGSSFVYDAVGVADAIVGNKATWITVTNADGSAFDPYGMAQADWNGDGDLDVITGDKTMSADDGVSGATLKLYLNDGSGKLEEQDAEESGDLLSELDAGNCPSVAIADLNGDGHAEVIAGSDDGAVAYFENNGSDRFDTGSVDPAIATFNGYSAVATLDYDGDGKQDLFVGGYNGDLHWYSGQGDNKFSDEGTFYDKDGGMIDVGTKSAPSFIDSDSDGDVDLLAGSSDGKIYVYLNDGAGKFTSSRTLKNSSSSTIDVGDYSKPQGLDVDADGDDDLLIGSSDGTVWVYTNDGAGQFAATSAFADANGLSVDVGYYSAPAAGDWDGDGDDDLVIASYTGQMQLYRNDGGGKFSQAGAGVRIDTDTQARPAVGDVDGDGDRDILMGLNSGALALYTNDGSDQFSVTENFGAYDFGSNATPTLVDWDGDGDMDVLCGDYNGTVTLFTNVGDGTFSATTNVASIDVGTYSAPDAVDWDGDGDTDLLIGNSAGSVTFHKNESGSLSASGTEISSVTATGSAIPDAEDFDGDGDLDIILGDLDGSITLYKNNGSGVFSKSTELDAINIGAYSAPDAVDWDGDGDFEILASNPRGWVYFYEKRLVSNFPIIHPVSSTKGVKVKAWETLPDILKGSGSFKSKSSGAPAAQKAGTKIKQSKTPSVPVVKTKK